MKKCSLIFLLILTCLCCGFFFRTDELRVGSSSDLRLTVSSNDAHIENYTQDKDIYFDVNDAGTKITALFIEGSTGNISIGTTTPAARLHTTAWARFHNVDIGVGSNQVEYGGTGVLYLGYKTTTTATNIGRYGISNYPYIRVENSNNIVTLGTDNTERIRIDTGGNVSIGTTDFGAGGAGVLSIKAGTHQTTMGADCASLFVEDVVAGTAELRCMDEAENETTLSPHNFSLFEPNESYVYPWSYYANNAIIGKEINVDMYGAVEAIEQLSGKKFIHTKDISKSEKTWTEKQTFLQKQKQIQEEVEVSLSEAIEEYEITEPSVVCHRIEYEFDSNEGAIVEVRIPIEKELPTGKFAKRLKAGIRLDEKTGKLYRKKRLDEVEIDTKKFKKLPKWMKDRTN